MKLASRVAGSDKLSPLLSVRRSRPAAPDVRQRAVRFCRRCRLDSVRSRTTARMAATDRGYDRRPEAETFSQSSPGPTPRRSNPRSRKTTRPARRIGCDTCRSVQATAKLRTMTKRKLPKKTGSLGERPMSWMEPDAGRARRPLICSAIAKAAATDANPECGEKGALHSAGRSPGP